MALTVYLGAMGVRFHHAMKLHHPTVDWPLLIFYPIVVGLYGLVVWFFGFHCQLIAQGYTTVEWCEKKAMKGKASDVVLKESGDATATVVEAASL